MKTQYISALLWYHNGDEEQKKTGFGVEMMYQKESERVQMTLEDFILPFGGKLDAGNRWVKLAALMPWDMIEDVYARSFKNKRRDGRPAIPARKRYLKIAKLRKAKRKAVKQAVSEQLDYVERGLSDLDNLLAALPKDTLKHRQWERLATLRSVAEQQRTHLENPQASIPDRIVNLRQPHVRPIVRGKAGHPVEFGQKLGFSVVDGYTFIDTQSFDNFNEGVTLIASAEKYKARFGHYPERILADTIYRNRENRRFCKEHGIRLSGPRLGRPKADELEADREIAYRDSCDRNIVESRNGIAKRRYGLDRILTYLSCTAKTEAALVVLAMNAAHCLRTLLRTFFARMFRLLRCSEVFSGFGGYPVGPKYMAPMKPSVVRR